MQQPLIDHATSIFGFLEKCVDKSVSPTKSMCKSVLGLIGDLADCIGIRIQTQLQLHFVE